jgi:hypothetical protein
MVHDPEVESLAAHDRPEVPFLDMILRKREALGRREAQHERLCQAIDRFMAGRPEVSGFLREA